MVEYKQNLNDELNNQISMHKEQIQLNVEKVQEIKRNTYEQQVHIDSFKDDIESFRKELLRCDLDIISIKSNL